MVALRNSELVTTYLEMTRRSAFRPGYLEGIDIQQMQTPDITFYRFLYNTVGAMWRWRERTLLSDTELTGILSKSQVFVLYCDGIPAGYIELAPPEDESVEIAYFGLRPEFFGRGFGKHLLSYGIAHAWASGAKRVWLHTCNLDGPHALDNYLKRGFRIFDVKREPMPALFL
jgi:ribosomal protein S18 acetylase RimI-like enzyme